MLTHSPKEITGLLVAWGAGDESALAALTPLVYEELHRLAHRYMGGERPGHSLQTTALVNEAYVRLIDWKNVRWQNRAHFFAVSAQLMRRILVDFARTRGYQKGGGGHARRRGRRVGRQRCRHGGARRGTNIARRTRRAAEPGGGTEILRGLEPRGDRRGAAGVAGDGAARLEPRPRLAAPRAVKLC